VDDEQTSCERRGFEAARGYSTIGVASGGGGVRAAATEERSGETHAASASEMYDACESRAPK